MDNAELRNFIFNFTDDFLIQETKDYCLKIISTYSKYCPDKLDDVYPNLVDIHYYNKTAWEKNFTQHLAHISVAMIGSLYTLVFATHLKKLPLSSWREELVFGNYEFKEVKLKESAIVFQNCAINTII
jgi:hypothetical protein